MTFGRIPSRVLSRAQQKEDTANCCRRVVVDESHTDDKAAYRSSRDSFVLYTWGYTVPQSTLGKDGLALAKSTANVAE